MSFVHSHRIVQPTKMAWPTTIFNGFNFLIQIQTSVTAEVDHFSKSEPSPKLVKK